MLPLDHLEAADAAADDHADPRGVFRRGPAGRCHFDRHRRGRQRELDEAAAFLEVLLVEPVERIEPLSLRRPIFTECREVSNNVIGPMPGRPARMPSHDSAVPTPTGHTRPTPVTTMDLRDESALLTIHTLLPDGRGRSRACPVSRHQPAGGDRGMHHYVRLSVQARSP